MSFHPSISLCLHFNTNLCKIKNNSLNWIFQSKRVHTLQLGTEDFNVEYGFA